MRRHISRRYKGLQETSRTDNCQAVSEILVVFIFRVLHLPRFLGKRLLHGLLESPAPVIQEFIRGLTWTLTLSTTRASVDLDKVLQTSFAPQFVINMIEILVDERRLSRQEGSTIEDYIFTLMNANGQWKVKSEKGQDNEQTSYLSAIV